MGGEPCGTSASIHGLGYLFSALRREGLIADELVLQLANPPYRQASIPPAYQRQVVPYHRNEAPGSILVDTDGRFLYYVLPEGRAIRYGAIVGEDGQAWSGRGHGRSQGRVAGMDADRG